MLDLSNNQYDLKTLKENIYALNLLDILKTQKLTAEFCVKYILNNKYQLTKEEESITIDQVFFLQPHINKEHLLSYLLWYHPDDDSVEDFESIAKK
jgi:hypothetical protein